MWPIQSPILFYCTERFFSPWTLCNTSYVFTRSVQLIYSILLQNQIKESESISDLLSQVSKFQLCSKGSTSLNSSVNLNPFCWWKKSTCCMLLLPWQFCIQFHLYILHHLLSYYQNNSNIFICSSSFLLSITIRTGDACLEILSILVFATYFSITLHRPISFSLPTTPVLPFLSQPVAQGHLYMKINKAL
jgi:hypothetical protein